MKQISNEQPDWYEDDESEAETSPVPGLPDSWRHYGRWVAAAGFAGLWIVDTILTLDTARDANGLGYVSGSLWRLMLALLICCAVFKLTQPYIGRLSYVVCGLGAAFFLLVHST